MIHSNSVSKPTSSIKFEIYSNMLIPVLSLLFIGKSTNMWSNELVLDVSKTLDTSHSNSRQMDSEFLLVAMERVTTLFDR